LLNEAVNICNLFVPKNEIIVTQNQNETHNNTYKTAMEPVDTEIPLVIIIMIKALQHLRLLLALQDLDRAVIVGSRSFEKA
jgi:carboxyl-terminal processing protease